MKIKTGKHNNNSTTTSTTLQKQQKDKDTKTNAQQPTTLQQIRENWKKKKDQKDNGNI